MLASARAAALLLLVALLLFTGAASADPSYDRREASRRVEVVLGTLGLERSSRGSLVALLGAELEPAGLALKSSEPHEPLTRWGADATRSERVLAALLLDARDPEGWRLVVIDAARGRAIARHISGGISEDAASIEAVISIAVSAALALREGLEVASTPLASVVGAPLEPPARPAGLPAKRFALTHPGSPEPAWRPRASIGASVASFSAAAPTTIGLAMTVGIRFRTHAEARLLGSFFIPAHVGGPLGDFRVARGWVGAAAGPVFETRAFSLTPEAGLVVERLSRFGATPAAGVVTTDSGGALYRLGGALSLRLRRTLLRPLSVELVMGAVYFGRSARFSARSAETSWSAEAWPALAFAQLGLEAALD